MHYQLIIISNDKYVNSSLNNIDYLYLDESHSLKDYYHTDNNLSFDYLIFKNLETINNLDILVDDDKVITNYYFQTNYDHIFAIGKINNSKLEENDQVNKILEFLV